MIYDTIIIGAGAAGLHAAARSPLQRGLLIEKTGRPGTKLLMSGAGQCNFTHGGDIRDFVGHYGDQGKKIRGVLFKYNNKAAVSYFEELGVPAIEREDGKVFPASLQAEEVLEALLRAAAKQGFAICQDEVLDISYLRTVSSGSSPQVADQDEVLDISYLRTVSSGSSLEDVGEAVATDISHLRTAPSEIPTESVAQDAPADTSYIADKRCNIYRVVCSRGVYLCRKLIIATGGCSYPATGSDGSIFPILARLGISLVPCKPSLAPVFVHEYPYGDLSGFSFKEAEVRCGTRANRDSLLFTHRGLSGPAVLNLSRWISQGDKLTVNYLPMYSDLPTRLRELQPKSAKQVSTVLTELDESISKSFAEAVARRAQLPADKKFSSLTGSELKRISDILTADTFTVTGLGSYNTAMVTAGGISLDEICLPSMELKKYPNMYAVGEVVDVDGDTGGYNLQFAFSSSYQAARHKTD